MAAATEIKEVDIKTLKPYKKNAKIHGKEQVEMIADSIKEFGFVSPCLIDRDMNLIAGHGRVEAAKLLKMETVPCVFVEGLTDEQRRAYILADNRLGELAEWDMDLVQEELADLADLGFDIELTGFELFDEEEEQEAEEDGYSDEDAEQAPTRCQPGDIWELGEHRLICGDCTDPETIEQLMDGEKADLVFTDPPYGMKKEKEGILNDNLNYDDLLEFNKKWIPLTFQALKSNGSWYCWGTDEPLMDIYSEILKPMKKKNEITFRNLLTWDKGNGQGQLSEDFRMYPIADEKCLFVMCGVQGYNTNADNYYEEWEPIREYFEEEIAKIGESDAAIAKGIGVQDGRTVNHKYARSQWQFITKEKYYKIKDYAKSKGIDIFKREYDEIKREYDEIKREYYKTRAFFDNTHDN